MHFSILPIFLAALLSQSTTAQTIAEEIEAQNDAGAEGPSSESSVGVSSEGMIILCTIVGVVVLIGVSSAALFVVAKRRQWAMRETITRSARQVTQAIKTPLTPRFPRMKPQGRDDGGGARGGGMRGIAKQQTKDVEKGSVSDEDVKKKGDDRRESRGWGSRFSFNRG
ncbi:hypothetical protein P168DRAFT_345512 [Aspergillus campestris IBT 28561]|uniref:Transmembrane protein n=1 Tax=Aspergillus campestris (strain IBT 28561) TaxID=1392248 RepID=A0A2I1CZG8_ASPC2|nr:uncharacterized protein P168DRAFT_345512 [Aspergillus campestris IBT 28561]PKY03018.1 hypothetical protein P168DRAFT_345512 [Aspergillus campestris IBT 28561]